MVTPFSSSSVAILHKPLNLPLDDLFVQYPVVDEDVVSLNILVLQLTDVEFSLGSQRLQIGYFEREDVFDP